MVEFSEADNYDDAKHEWKATGRCWWRSADREVPDWVANSGHPFKCLCGHDIVYHFEIENSVTGHFDVVGSDHINSYLILKEIAESTGIAEEHITEAMIQEWIDVRVKSMKKDAWWHENGEHFEEMFDACKELDLRINVRHTNETYFDETLRVMRPVTHIRKATNKDGMASIVWRWNHPDNPKAQIHTRGYPTKKLMKDLIRFDLRLDDYIAAVKVVDDGLESRQKYLKRLDAFAKDEIVEAYKKSKAEGLFVENCNKLGIPSFNVDDVCYMDYEKDMLKMLRNRLSRPLDVNNIPNWFTRHLSEKLRGAIEMTNGADEPATPKQMMSLDLHYKSDKIPDDIKQGFFVKDRAMTKREASIKLGILFRSTYNIDRVRAEIAALSQYNSFFTRKALELKSLGKDDSSERI